MSRSRVVALIVLIFVSILGFDVYLYSDGVDGNSFSQVIIWLTDRSPLIPWFVGFVMGALAIHWFESYFLRKKPS